jgi:hypothetical protein
MSLIAGVEGQALAALERLRVASVDRLVRELAAASITASRGEVAAALAGKAQVVWVGRSIVAMREGTP